MDSLTLPLPSSLRSKLLEAGFANTSAFQHLTPLQLARDANISHQEALAILKTVSWMNCADQYSKEEDILSSAKTAWDLLCYEKSRKKLRTCCSELDTVLGGGFKPKELTEICGVPGVGKTQLGMQLSINVQIPSEFGGLGGQAVYIDTEGSFMVERALQMAESMIDYLKYATSSCESTVGLGMSLNVDTFLSHIFYYRVYDCTEQLAVVNSLEEFLKEHREDFQDWALRTRLLNGMAQKLMGLAQKHDVVVVLVNQVTTKTNGEIVPALGESWSHTCTNRLILSWSNGCRQVHIFKSPSLPAATASFAVSADGIRDVESSKRIKLCTISSP
ncbi:hypothetical protein O6H91_23G069400 [Diphasiastrum complanatum]|uniref:Uncharacterized protein n=1 Tax=Diphasiastrum complanatum TaxID=34168 RepID=A0ACC2AC13_DIPCM|nr:hypothetical protein O6H91_23G069400 [Diphasiastrum complanatum]